MLYRCRLRQGDEGGSAGGPAALRSPRSPAFFRPGLLVRRECFGPQLAKETTVVGKKYALPDGHVIKAGPPSPPSPFRAIEGLGPTP